MSSNAAICRTGVALLVAAGCLAMPAVAQQATPPPISTIPVHAPRKIGPVSGQSRQLTDADYARAAKFLGRSTDPLVGYNHDPRVWHEVRTVHWVDATHFWYRDHDGSGDHFLEMDAATGRIAPAFDEGRLGAALGKASGKSVTARNWPYDFDFQRLAKGTLAVTLRGKHYRCDLSGSGVCTQPDTESKSSGRPAPPLPHAPGLSPNGRLVAFAKDSNLWVRNVATGKATRLTADGVKDDGYGPLVHWSPDSKMLVTFRFDSRGIQDQYTIKTGIGHPQLQKQAYPLPGDSKVFMVQPVLIDVAAGKSVPLNMGEEQLLGSWYDVQWAPDSKTFALVSTSRNRRQETFRVVDAGTGYVRTAFRYTARDFYQGWYSARPIYAQGQPGNPDWHYLPRTGEAIWPSAQNNWMNLYLYDLRTGKQVRALTRGKGDVIQVPRFDSKTHTLWYVGVGRTPGMNPYYQQLFKLDLDTGKSTLLTPEDADHMVTMSKDGRYFVDSYSTPTQPPVTVLRSASTGRILATVARTDISRLVADGWVPPIPFTVKARDHKTTLYGLMYKPSHFNADEKYPVIDFVYPGPQIGSIATFSFRSERGASQALAELGFIVVTLDGMCTPYRSASFQRQCYGDIGDDTIPDQVTAIRQLAARHPWMDLGRVGIWGHSGGGNATVSAMLHYPDFFKVGWAESGNYDARSYYYTWGEKWEGQLVTNKNGTSNYDNQAMELLAQNLKGHLMLVHGSIDNNVPVGITYQLVSALMKANKDFQMLIVPDEKHHFGQFTPYVTRRMFDWFVKYLAGNTPPREFNGMPTNLTQ